MERIWWDARGVSLGPTEGRREVSSRPTDAGGLFAEALKRAMAKVNAMQLEASSQVERASTGDVEDISQVVLAVERADLALRLITEVRNRLLDAYNQLSRLS